MSEGPVVVTRRGAVRGVARETDAAFLGIPFAQPPVGPLRFGAPVPPEPWDDVRDATAYGPTPQRGDPGATFIPEPSIPGDATLNVNVFTPEARSDAALPVLVWIHGGGFLAGSPASPWYDGATFARDGIVVVTLSYRLGFDGFGWIEGAPQNRGLRDMIAALEWVRDEIAAFGGDPARVTVAGQSAGGAAVLALLAAPSASGLFSAAFAVSPALTEIPVDRARALGARMAELAGVSPDRAGFASVPEEALHAHQRQALRTPGNGRLAALAVRLSEGLPWGPVIDGDILPEPISRAVAHRGLDVPLVIGATDDEFSMIADPARNLLRFVPAGWALARLGVAAAVRRPWLAVNGHHRRHGTAGTLGRFATDRIFRAGVRHVALARGDAPTWVYRFSWASPVNGWASHCLDVPFWFEVLDDPKAVEVTGGSAPRDLADAMHASAAAFVRAHDPGWPTWSGAPGRTRVFGAPASAPDLVPDGFADAAALA